MKSAWKEPEKKESEGLVDDGAFEFHFVSKRVFRSVKQLEEAFPNFEVDIRIKKRADGKEVRKVRLIAKTAVLDIEALKKLYTQCCPNYVPDCCGHKKPSKKVKWQDLAEDEEYFSCDEKYE